ncbi:hypothetical protein HD554DRAFT_1022375 [Boletus coccyginus]|nr:hypothetical protein HD554DRAFT_1022375 [Boletus coccyginus]
MEANLVASKTPHHPVEENIRVKAPPPQRSGPRYKEKFQALREKFDQVNALHDEYQRDLELANARVRKLQSENDLLLDAISITVPATPSLMHLIRPSPTGTSSSMPITSYTHPPPSSYPQSVPVNGHGHDHANGRYRDRDREYDRSEVGLDICRFMPSL